MENSMLILLAVFILGWECFETGYSYARYGRVIPVCENVLGFGWYFIGRRVKLLHTARFLAGIALISWGVLS